MLFFNKKYNLNLKSKIKIRYIIMEPNLDMIHVFYLTLKGLLLLFQVSSIKKCIEQFFLILYHFQYGIIMLAFSFGAIIRVITIALKYYYWYLLY